MALDPRLRNIKASEFFRIFSPVFNVFKVIFLTTTRSYKRKRGKNINAEIAFYLKIVAQKMQRRKKITEIIKQIVEIIK